MTTWRMEQLILSVWLGIPLLMLTGLAAEPANPPRLVFPGRLTEVIDGDTVTVQIELPVRIRMLDCYAPELSQPGGRESRRHLESIAGGHQVEVEVPLVRANESSDVFSFGRLLANVRIPGDTLSLSERQVLAGKARSKP